MKTDKKYIIERELIELCKIQILSKAGFVDNQVLAHKDFEYLCFVIKEKSKINLSASTLKRIWKNEYDRLPQDSTLDALAQYIDFESWNAFKRDVMREKESKPQAQKLKFQLRGKRIFTFTSSILICCCSYGCYCIKA